MIRPQRTLKAGDHVEVRSKEEILATLDATGSIERLPFMPEMLRFCGQQLRVASIAHKTCDTATKTGGRKLERTVHLEGARCDGAAHGGCQAACLIFWREEWLKLPENDGPARTAQIDEAGLHAATRQPSASGAEARYRCQATQITAASTLLPWWNVRQYVADVRSRNESFGRLLSVLAFAAFHRLVKMGVAHRLLVGTYNRLQKLVGGCHYPFLAGTLPAGAKPPPENLSLKPGELVRIKSHEQILGTLTKMNKNRGLWFGAELVPYCGGTYRVHSRVERIIDEVDGKMLTMKSPCIVLHGVVCRSQYSEGRLLCPRAIYSYWRESWLERVPRRGSENTEARTAAD
jgi:hypothetical protein